MSDPATILQYQQGNDVAPPPDGYEHITNPLNPLLRSASRLAHFSDGVYDLSAESHLMRLLKALLGDSGVGGVQKAMLLVRLQQTLGGTHFFDLDAFYGGIFGVHRATDEHLTVDPHSDLVAATEWDQLRISDGSYRSRAARLTSAIQLGSTIKGIEAVAEAMTGVEFDVIEGWMYPAYKRNTWERWEAGTWDDMEAFTWDELEYSETATVEVPRNMITLYPHEQLSEGARFDVERVIDRIKPVNAIVVVSDDVVNSEIHDIAFAASSTSEKWEVRQQVRNSRINGILPYPNYPEDEFIEPPNPPWAGYTGEAWTVLDRNPRTLAYSTPQTISLTEQLDVTSVNMAPQAFLQVAGSTQVVSLPEYSLKPVQGLYSGRSVSDGIVLTNPYGDRDSGQSGMIIDHVDADFIAGQITSQARTSQRFWTTPVRWANDPTNDVLGIRFDEPVTVNRISFDYARFPCRIDVQFWDRATGQWSSLGTINNQESSPYGIGNTPPPDAVHSYHYGSDHWAKASMSFDARVGQHWRIVCIRRSGTGPVGISGTAIPYPLGIRDLDMGFRVMALNQVPHVSPVAAIHTGRNIVGLQVRYFLERARATLVEDALPTAWICEPQPIRDAVVNMYLKFRSSIPEVVNQIYLDPVQSGVVANLYYTDKVPIGLTGGVAQDELVTPVAVHGSVNAERTGPERGLTLGSGQPAWVDIDLHDVGGGASQMWIGREYVLDDVMLMDTPPRVACLDAISLETGLMMLVHGIFKINTDADHYIYYVDVIHNGIRSRITWPIDEIPPRNARLRLCVEFRDGFTPNVWAQIGDGAVYSVVDNLATIGDDGYTQALNNIFSYDAWVPFVNTVPLHYNVQQEDLSLVLQEDGSVIGQEADPEIGDGSFVSTPHNDNQWIANTVDGIFSITARISLNDVREAGGYGGYETIASKWTNDGQHGWIFAVDNGGVLTFTWSTDGIDSRMATSTERLPVVDGMPFWVNVTMLVETGQVSFTISDDIDQLSPSNWISLGEAIESGPATMHPSHALITIGSNFDGTAATLNGRIFRVVLQTDESVQDAVLFMASDALPNSRSWVSKGAYRESWVLHSNAFVERGLYGDIIEGGLFGGFPLVGNIERFGSSNTWHSFARLTLAVNGYGAGPKAVFLDRPERYALIPVSGVAPETNGTFLRFHPDYIDWGTGTNLSLGFVGGLPDSWAEASWTPIGQTVITKGKIAFGDVIAVALKIEFTNLIAEPYEAFIPVNTTVTRIANPTAEDQGASRTDLDQAMITLHSANRFQDVVTNVALGQDARVNLVSPTTAIAVIDGTVRDQAAAQFGFGYNMAQWQVAGRSPIQSKVGVHSYVVSEVQAISRTAFFVGLRTVSVQRKVSRSLGDGKAYDDTLLHADNLDLPTVTFEVEPGQIFTPESPSSRLLDIPRVAISLPYVSRRPVHALQFATQQTGPIELLPDDEFRNPSLVYYDFADTSDWHNSGDGIVFWDQGSGAVRVSRNPSVLDAFYAPDTPIVHPPVSPVLASGFSRTVVLDFASYGGISSPAVAVSPRGLLYVGCRVMAWNELSAPLFLRIYGSDETTVLAEQSFTPQVNVPSEIVLPYVINNTTLDRSVQVRVEQDGPYMDSWLMSSLSAFDTSVLWEFSVDDGETWTPGHIARSLRNGVVSFPYSGSALRWKVTAYRYNCVIDAIRMRPWYLNRLGSEL